MRLAGAATVAQMRAYVRARAGRPQRTPQPVRRYGPPRATVPGMFTVIGYIPATGIPYELTFGEDPARAAWGACDGSPEVLGLLMTLGGSMVSPTPTGPAVTLAGTDGTSVMYALHQHTVVLQSTGEVPPVPPVPPGATG